MKRVKYEDLERHAKQIDWFLNEMGLLPEGWESYVEKGSKINGISYKLTMLDEAKGERRHPAFAHSYGFLGFTAKESAHTLDTISRTLEAVWSAGKS